MKETTGLDRGVEERLRADFSHLLKNYEQARDAQQADPYSECLAYPYLMAYGCFSGFVSAVRSVDPGLWHEFDAEFCRVTSEGGGANG